jgi:hypothetical protein
MRACPPRAVARGGARRACSRRSVIAGHVRRRRARRHRGRRIRRVRIRPAHPKLARPKPARPKPADAKPAHPKPARPKPADAKPAHPKPARPKSAPRPPDPATATRSRRRDRRHPAVRAAWRVRADGPRERMHTGAQRGDALVLRIRRQPALDELLAGRGGGDRRQRGRVACGLWRSCWSDWCPARPGARSARCSASCSSAPASRWSRGSCTERRIGTDGLGIEPNSATRERWRLRRRLLIRDDVEHGVDQRQSSGGRKRVRGIRSVEASRASVS